MKRKSILLSAIAAMAVLLTSCGGKQSLPTNDEYPVVTIGAANAQLKTTFPATIKGVQDVEVRPKVSGFITKLYVHEGEYVRAGQVLFVVDNSTLSGCCSSGRGSSRISTEWCCWCSGSCRTS